VERICGTDGFKLRVRKGEDVMDCDTGEGKCDNV